MTDPSDAAGAEVGDGSVPAAPEPSAAELEHATGGRWRVWRGVTGLLYARLYQTSPPVVLRNYADPRALWAAMGRHDPDLPDFPGP